MQVRYLLEDVNSTTCGSDYLCGNLEFLTANIIQAWEVVREARCANPSSSCASLMPQDFVLLQKVASLKQSSTFIANIGSIAGNNDGNQALITAMKKHVLAKCFTCDNDPTATHIDYLSDYLENLRYFAANFSNTLGTGGTGGVWNQGITGSATQVVGGAYMLKLLKDENYNAQNVQQFELDLSDSPDPTRPKKADIVELNESTTILVECKSWTYGDANFSGLKNGTSASYIQFITYLKNINSLAELKYYFDARRTNMTESYVKEVFQDMFKNNVANLFKQTTQGGLGLTKIQQLFGANISTQQDFLYAVDIITDNSIYNFVKIK